ncbi:hypothetical protein FSP39_005499 [Pinctada imbricata]|uniref:Ig-like domain-containing protein n=1 Tax=Pinctada imbricata TaxID=66713 RepID=A0AA88Y981_PINIB|nr:hypothetical protein FSP39_005499 [Pinctada imbricata]
MTTHKQDRKTQGPNNTDEYFNGYKKRAYVIQSVLCRLYRAHIYNHLRSPTDIQREQVVDALSSLKRFGQGPSLSPVVTVSQSANIFAVEPTFDVPVVNITVVAGKTAVLPCSIDFLGDYKVVWTDRWSTLLTLETKRIIDDERMGVDRPYTSDWNLIIHDVKYEDRGRYTCQINTQPVKTKEVELVVLVPPKILDSSSSDVRSREGETVTLTCNVTGVPPPTVQWFRRRFQDALGNHKERVRTSILHSGLYKPDEATPRKSCYYTVHHAGVGLNGEKLIIHNITRYCDGIYECMAFNQVEPAVNREMKVEVQFSPEVNIQPKRLSQSVGKETILECDILAFPQVYSVWIFNDKVITSEKERRRLDVYTESDNFITLSIRLLNLTKEDFGEYRCFAKNELGQDEEFMYLSELMPRPPPTLAPTTQAPLTRPRTTPSWEIEVEENIYDTGDNGNASLDMATSESITSEVQHSSRIECSGGIFYICGPVADHSSMGNSGRTLYLSSMCFLPFSILTIALLNPPW